MAPLVVDVQVAPEGPVRIQVPAGPGHRERNFDRPRDEALEKTLRRMGLSLAPQAPKGKERSVREPLPLTLLDTEGRTIDGSLSLSAAFAAGFATALAVGLRRYRVRLNRPEVTKIECLDGPLVGCPLLPSAEAQFCRPDQLAWEWRRESDGVVVGQGRRYVPTAADRGSRLGVVARPLGDEHDGDGGSISARWVSAEPVSLAPPDVGRSGARVAALQRQLEARSRASSGGHDVLRIVSYNVLADAYSHYWDQAFPYCGAEFLRPEYRLQLLRLELCAYDADIVCLQEVDERWFQQYWEPQLASEGYEARFTPKTSGAGEGCAVLFRRHRFELLELRELDLTRPPRVDVRESGTEAATGELLAACPALADLWSRLGQVAQLALLRCRSSGRTLLACNTHLYFAGMARHVRILQSGLILGEASRMAADAATDAGVRPALVLCGDFNSTPAAADMLRALRSEEPGTSFARLAGRGRGGALERQRRMRACLAVLTGAAPHSGGGEAPEESEEAPPPASPAGTSVAHSSLGSGRHETAETAKQPSARDVLEAALAAGATFRSSTVVAAAQLALDAGLSGAPVVALSEEMLKRATEAATAEAATAETEIQDAIDEQAACSQQAEAVANDGVRASRVGKGLEMRHHLSLASRQAEASAYSPPPPFTNLVSGYASTLDWIFFDSSRLARAAEAPVPDREELEAEATALPSQRFPSDHVLLAADLEWQ
ncbi:unnamed protein product [Prorocentrum cordatum]|uniref:Endonuclease/exonuclease/phosphatase domain-containing protein n=1 Tax=Prorocentrum cordatum TaxID=2364126 RepID=A0ABN9SXC8_9DINO|nr:unnamed protein product [Polarella glacialis]